MDIVNKIYNKDFRQKLTTNPKRYYKEFNDGLLDDVEIVVKKNTKDISYIVMPASDIGDLDRIQAAGVGCAGSVGSVFTASTLGTATSTASSFGSAGSIGTAGCGA